jgi:hypothetical protein
MPPRRIFLIDVYASKAYMAALAMTADELKAWIKRRRLSHREASYLLAMSIDGLRKNLYGQTPIGAQTERLAQVWDLAEPEMEKWRKKFRSMYKQLKAAQSTPK